MKFPKRRTVARRERQKREKGVCFEKRFSLIFLEQSHRGLCLKDRAEIK
jgi:hypothetical protein